MIVCALCDNVGHRWRDCPRSAKPIEPLTFFPEHMGSEFCADCGKHIAKHFGGTEYRCHPLTEDAPIIIARLWPRIWRSFCEAITLDVARQYPALVAEIRELRSLISHLHVYANELEKRIP